MPTMGEALPALTKRLANGDVFVYAIGNFVTGSGRSLEGEGVIPDDVVPVSSQALAAGRDAVMERALQWVDERRPLGSRSQELKLFDGAKSLLR
jgi:C-terminal processing protease CtpA/Prc